MFHDVSVSAAPGHNLSEVPDLTPCPATHRLGGGSNSMMLGDRVYMEYSTTCAQAAGTESAQGGGPNHRTSKTGATNTGKPARHHHHTRLPLHQLQRVAALLQGSLYCGPVLVCVPQARGAAVSAVSRGATRHAVVVLRDKKNQRTLSCLCSLNPSNTRRRTYLGAKAGTARRTPKATAQQPRARACDATARGNALSDVVVGAAATRAEEGARQRQRFLSACCRHAVQPAAMSPALSPQTCTSRDAAAFALATRRQMNDVTNNGELRGDHPRA
jgi:hypothetical protein